MRFVETPVFTEQIVGTLDDDAYPKNVQDDLTPAQLRILKRLVEKEFK